MAKINDLDLGDWKQYDEEITTDSLWVIKNRDNSGVHSGHYHGNFIPQIPHQLLLRFTKKGDLILDPFSGSGTTLIEAQRLGRNSIGIELQESVAKEAISRIRQEKNETLTEIFVGDSGEIDTSEILKMYDKDNFQFVIFHPPYWDILKFSENNNDLSNSQTLDIFLNKFEKVIINTTHNLEKSRHCAVIIGDKSTKGEIIPLGFYCMQLFMKLGFELKATIIKNFEETKGKANSKSLWRYRALAGNFYIFKHEYIFVFQKKK